MAVITYVIGYQSGAAVSSPIVSFYISDTYQEMFALPKQTPGDICYSKDISVLYYRDATIWQPLFPQDAKFPITGDFLISRDNPTILLNDISPSNTYNYITNLDGNAHISINARITGSGWVKTDPAANASVFVINRDYIRFYTIDTPAGSGVVQKFNVTTAGNLGLAGGIFEQNRGAAGVSLAGVIGIPFNSGNFTSDVGGITISEQIIYAYSLYGTIMTLWWNLHGTISGAPGQIYLHWGSVSNAKTNGQPFGMGIMYDLDGKSWRSNRVHSNNTWDCIIITKVDYANFAVGDFYTQGQFSLPITGV